MDKLQKREKIERIRKMAGFQAAFERQKYCT
jgi:hypothetical protein